MAQRSLRVGPRLLLSALSLFGIAPACDDETPTFGRPGGLGDVPWHDDSGAGEAGSGSDACVSPGAGGCLGIDAAASDASVLDAAVSEAGLNDAADGAKDGP